MAVANAAEQIAGRFLSVLLVSFLASGCFYDSRWGQQKKAQQHQAAHLSPQKLERQSTQGSPLQAQRTLSLRVHATPTYQASVVGWQQQFQEQLDCANSILAPDFGVSLKLEELKTFRPHAGEEKLDDLLNELVQLDAAKGADLVVGLASASPHFATSADELGMARMLGQHLVLRAMSDVHEYEAIREGFNELSEEERRKLYSVRKRHKLCTVLLHEVAHTLGVPHERMASSLMNSRYNVQTRGFSAATAELLRVSLAARAPGQPVAVDVALAQRLEELLRAPSADWEPKGRDALLSQLAAMANASVATATHAHPRPVAVAFAPTSSPAIGLEANEQHIYDNARAELNAGHAADAQKIAKPLWDAHGNLPAVQELRCNIAMAIGGDPDSLDAACAGISAFGSAH